MTGISMQILLPGLHGVRQAVVLIGQPVLKIQNLVKQFMDLGIDSLDAQKLALNLNARLGLVLSDTVIFEQPNVNELAQYIHEQLGGARLSSGSCPSQQRFQMGLQQQQQHVAGSSAHWPGSTTTSFAFVR